MGFFGGMVEIEVPVLMMKYRKYIFINTVSTYREKFIHSAKAYHKVPTCWSGKKKKRRGD